MSIIAGQIVLANNDVRLFGKIASVNADTVGVEFFHSVAERYTDEISLSEVSRFELLRQTRVFVEDYSGYWQVGRIIGALKDDSIVIYDVRFPNGKNREVHETDLYVRCLDVFADPAEILALGCGETQYFADRRRRALWQLRNLRSSCEGLTGPFSSAIDLVPHQIATVRKVLQDPYLRYLLADEVGLGKTIEAGCIIRQTLIDRPGCQIVVLVPEILVDQWKRELKNKFYINCDEGDVCVASYEDDGTLDLSPDFLVIDEAHQVIATDQAARSPIIDRIQNLAHSVPNLLLLSATPALGEEERLFGLLHLLDPVSYPLKDRDGFKEKVDLRQEIGRLLLPMQSGGTPFVVRRQASSACEMFPDDAVVQELAQNIIDAHDDQNMIDESVNLLRDHIARTYRIHDRLLRSRRSDAEAWAMRPRAEPYPNVNHLRYVFDNASSNTDLYGLLEGWRISAQTTAQTKNRPELIDRWRSLVGSTFQGRNSLRNFLSTCGELFPGEQEHIDALIETANNEYDDDLRYEAIFEDLKDWRNNQPTPLAGHTQAKIVCFASDLVDAERILNLLKRKFGPFDAIGIAGVVNRITRAEKLETFKQDPESWILVADTSAEEGLNLQFIHAIIHMDIPVSVARLEQRIGRLDRYGRRIAELQHRVLLPNDDEDAPWYIWTHLLLNGFRIFNNSVSDVQFALEALEQQVWQQFFDEGASCAEELNTAIYEAISEERKKLNEQHALDELANLNDQVEDFVERMEDAESDEGEIGRDVQSWMHGVLRINQYPPHPEPHEHFKVFWDRRNTLIPMVPWHRLIEPALDTALTWRRYQAQKTKNHPVLLRAGSNLINALERFAAWDDRGIAYATWRIDPSANATWMGFRLVWVLAPKLTSVTAVWERHERPDLVRQAESYLPIKTFDQFVDFEGKIVDDPAILTRMSAPYTDKRTDRGYKDINLGSRPDIFEAAIDSISFQQMVRKIRPICEDLVRRDPNVVEILDRAHKKFERDAALIERSQRQRQIFLQSECRRGPQGLSKTIQDLESIRNAISEPDLRLDEIGFIVISSELP